MPRLSIEKVCISSLNGYTDIRVVSEATGADLLTFDERTGRCQKPGDERLQEMFDNGTDYILVADPTDGPSHRLRLLDRDPLMGSDL